MAVASAMSAADGVVRGCMMNLEKAAMYDAIKSVRATGEAGETLAVCVCQSVPKLPKAYEAVDRAAAGAVSAMLRRTEFQGERGQIATLYPAGQHSSGAMPERVYVVGLGMQDKLDTAAVRMAAATAVKEAAKAGIKRLTVHLMGALGKALSAEDAGRALGEGMTIGRFTFDEFLGSASNKKPSRSKGTSAASGKSGDISGDTSGETSGETSGHNSGETAGGTLKVGVEEDCRRGFERGLKVGASVNIARELSATPPNVANPAFIVKYCRAMAKKVGLKCTVIDAAKAKELGMGGLSAVGQAGSTPPAMIVLEHQPSRSTKKPPVLLVGKAITFDTGGYSIKINNGMLGMKYDKCGGMSVIGAMHAAATLKVPVPVVGIIAAAENMVDTDAYRPNDILTMVNGVTVEVTNTDAEGRLVLADALAYGCKKYKPQAVIDLATLTGGVVVALGSICAGCFCGDAPLRERLFDAGDFAGERLWHLPLWDEHRELMKGTHSDIVNSGAERGAHPIQGAAFLSWFATPGGKPERFGELPWAHLDIAGVADTKNPTALHEKGPTGFGVSLLARALENWK